MSSNNILLIGFSGTGKTCVGERVARLLGWKFIDTDDEIVHRVGKLIDRIFKEDGEPAFRSLEKQVLREACSNESTVISTGGGVMVDKENRELALARGLVVCLEARPETIYHRLLGSRGESAGPVIRPLLTGPDPLERIRSLKSQRQIHYAMAHWTVHTDNLTEEQVAQEVVRAWQIMKMTAGAKRLRYSEASSPLQGGKLMQDENVAAVVTHSNGSYPILVGWGLLEQLGEHLIKLGIKGPVYIISDDRVFSPYGRRAQVSLQQTYLEAHCFIIPSGERSKTLEMAQVIYQWLVERRAERKHAIIAVGGGVVGDLAGFVAATFLRGVPFIQVPTSMAAMVDASIGGKVAVNLPQGKNLVGAFYQPLMVLADVQALITLGRRELAEGWAEAIKHGLILDAALFDVFEEHAEDLMSLKRDISTQVIRRSMAIKAQIVSEDERETLDRRILLNYGHTIGHALEAATGYERYMHGEAVSIGMMGEAYISHRLGLIGQDVIDRQRRVLERFNLPVKTSNVDQEKFFKAMALDKKTEAGSIKWVLLERVGKAVVKRGVPQELVREAVMSLL